MLVFSKFRGILKNKNYSRPEVEEQDKMKWRDLRYCIFKKEIDYSPEIIMKISRSLNIFK